jgi:N6-adenosine-specific RNA methylase IME4
MSAALLPRNEALPSLEKARALLSNCRKVQEVMRIKAIAQAVASCEASEQARDEASAIVLLSKARIGELTEKIDAESAAVAGARGGRGKKGVSGANALSRSGRLEAEGLTRVAAAECEKIADLKRSGDLDRMIKAGARPTTSGAVALAKLTDRERRKAIAKLGDLPDVKAAIREVAREQAIRNVGKAGALTGKFRVFYADPPWKYGDTGYGKGTLAAGFHYPTMSIDELCALPVQKMAIADSVLFLWVTSPLLEDGFKVINAWGFRYKASFVWDKIKHNLGHYNSVRHEFLLIATRGSCTPDDRRLVDSVQSIERTEHSAKPAQFRELIDQLYPHGPRVELFARKKAKGWKQWGNQI